jgi:hypothetical protein
MSVSDSLQGSRFAVDEVETRTRYEAVSRYLSASVMSKAGFCCTNFEACKASHPDNFSEGQLHYVGRRYALVESGRPLRLVVVGQEFGEAVSLVTMDSRREQIEASGFEHRFKASTVDGHRFPARNPHMRGTTSLLRLLVGGKPGADFDGEHLTLADGTRVHLFECFALVNYLLCGAHAGQTARGNSTRIMKDHCRGHFKKVIELLAPSVVIIQSEGFKKMVFKAFDQIDLIAERLYRARIGETTFLVCALSHPSSHGTTNWGTNESGTYLLNVVAPCVASARKELGLANA